MYYLRTFIGLLVFFSFFFMASGTQIEEVCFLRITQQITCVVALAAVGRVSEHWKMKVFEA